MSETAHETAFPTIAGSPEGYAVFLTNETGSEDESCTGELLRLNRELEVIGTSHALGASLGGELLSTDEGYLAVWTHAETREPETVEICSARFSPAGELSAAPACSAPLPYDVIAAGYSRAAFGAEGLGVLVALETEDPSYPRSRADILAFQRLDAAGIPVSPPLELLHGNRGISALDRYAIAFGDGVFGALYESQDFSTGFRMRFQRLVVE